jgi:O-antigen chain-terminating methyltransferase
MIETSNPEINVDELMARIREAAARLPNLDFPDPVNFANATSSSPVALPRAPSPPAFVIKSVYALADFLDAHDEAFIRRAYRGILGREPDVGGFENYLEQLRSGRVAKVEILGRLRYSPEGRNKAVKIRGMLAPFVIASLRRLPLIGYGLQWLITLLRLPTLVRSMTRFENDAIRRLEQTNRLFNQGMEGCEQALADLNTDKANTRKLAEALARIEALERQLKEQPLVSAMPRHPVDQQINSS